MLSKQHRLPIKDFPPKAEVLFRGKLLLAKRAENSFGADRVGISAPSGRIKGAVARNTLKRFITDFFASSLEGGVKGRDLLIIATAPIMKLDPAKKQEVREELRKIKSLLENTGK